LLHLDGRGAFIFWDIYMLEDEAPRSLQTSRSDYPMTQCNIPEEWIPFSSGIFAFACFLLSWCQTLSLVISAAPYNMFY